MKQFFFFLLVLLTNLVHGGISAFAVDGRLSRIETNSITKKKTLEFEWTCTDANGINHDFAMSFDCPNFEYMEEVYSHQDHTVSGNSEWVHRMIFQDPFIVSIGEAANQLFQLAYENNICPARVAVSFVQSLPYNNVADTYHRFPVETLIDEEGKCSDKSLLLAALLKLLSFRCILIDYGPHMALGVANNSECLSGFSGTYYSLDGVKYFFVDATNTDPIGSPPIGYDSGTLIPVK